MKSKSTFNKLFTLAIAFITIGIGFASVIPATTAQTYPITTPTYIPSAVKPAVPVVSGVNSTMSLNGIGNVGFQFAGACTGLAANVEGSVDGTHYLPVLAHPLGAGSAASAVSSVSATGAWRVSTTGLKSVRLGDPMNVSSVAVGCTVAETGTQATGVLE